MNALLVIIMESDVVSQALAQSLGVTLEDHVDTVHMTYTNSRMSRDLLLKTDLFLLDVFNRDAQGHRAEGIFVAEKFAVAGRRSLLIAGGAKADQINSDYFWDFAAKDYLAERILRVLNLPPPSLQDFGLLRTAFAPYCRPPYDGHHH